MNEKQFYVISVLSLATVVALAVLGEYFQSVSLLFNVMLTVLGVIAGILTSLYFAKQQESENLGRFASLAFRLSTDVYDSLTDTITSIQESGTETSTVDSHVYSVRLEELANKLHLIQRFAITANNNWKHLLPPEEQNELSRKETTIALVPLSSDHQVRIKERKVPYSDESQRGTP